MADGLPLGRGRSAGLFQFVPETMFVFGGSDLLTADGPPGLQRLVLAHNDCTMTHWFIMVDSPVFEPRTDRDFAEKSVTASF